MSDEPSNLLGRRPPVREARPQWGRLWRLVLKELREILRDRRTIITLVVMPLLIYPLLAVVFQRFLVTSLTADIETTYVVGVDSPNGQKTLLKQMAIGDELLQKRKRDSQPDVGVGQDRDRKKARNQALQDLLQKHAEPNVLIEDCSDADLEKMVRNSDLNLAAVYRQERQDETKSGLKKPFVWELFYRAGSPTSEAALDYVESRLQASDEVGLDSQLKKLDVSAELPAAIERHPISFSGAPVFSLAALIPLILVLMTVTGAVYPAIDLTAGERERGTLETLIAAPVPRLGLLFAKYVAVLTVALLTAVVNLIGMTITAHTSGLAAGLFGGGMSFDVVIKVLLLLALFAAFFSAILLAITSYARSFKEAQAYIIPLMLLCLVPGVLCLLPSVEFKGWMAVTPLVNIVMLARDLLEGSVQPGLAVVSVCSTLIYIAAAIGVAARIFGTDAILYGSPATWSDLIRQPREPQPAASLAAALFGLAVMFPVMFVLSNGLGQSRDLSMQRQFVVRAAITAAIFGGIPMLVFLAGRVRLSSGFGLRRTSIAALLGGAILGLSLWPAAHELTLAFNQFAITPELIKKFEGLVNQFKTMPLWVIVATMAVVPAICEELCFRGFLFSAMRQRLSGFLTVVLTALLFGVFHDVLIPGKLVTTAALGLVLGWVRLRTGSVLPGMLLHAVNNTLLLTVIYYRDQLQAHGWGVEEEAHLPTTWHLAAAVGVFVGVGLLLARTRLASTENSSSGSAANTG